MKSREFQRKSGKAIWYWKIAQDGESYSTEHGQIGTDKPQTFSDTPGPKGKEDTKAYVNAVDNCAFHVEREVRKKEERGYIEYVNGEPLKEEVTELVFSKCLPKNFCSYKPQTSITDAALAKIHDAGRARYTRKYDGMQHVCCKHPWGWEIYTRRMDLTTERFPHHVAALNKLSYDTGTILVGEMVCWSKTGKGENFKDISRFCRSDVPTARQLVEDGEVLEPTFLTFDILFHNENDLSDWSYDDRRNLYSNTICKLDELQLISVVHQFKVTPDNWEERAKKEGWEGFVITDGAAVPGAKFYSFDGDAKRPKGHHKLKPVYEDDVVIYAGVMGSGKRLGTVGSVLVKQIHPETKEWFRCGKVGSGFSDEDIAEIATELVAEGLPLYNKEKEDDGELGDEGIVAMIEFSERQPGTNKFRFPVFMRIRTDKLPKECVAQRLGAEE